MATATRRWEFEASLSKMAVEVLSARLVGRKEHTEAGLTVLHRRGADAMFEVAYAWAIGVAIVCNPNSPTVASDRNASTAEIRHPPGQQGRELAAAYRALVAAAVNRQRDAAWEMWQTLSVDDMELVMCQLLESYVDGLTVHGVHRAG